MLSFECMVVCRNKFKLPHFQIYIDRAYIDAFQEKHHVAMRAEYEQAKAEGKIPTFWQLLKANPILFTLYWVTIIGVAALTLIPVFAFFN